MKQYAYYVGLGLLAGGLAAGCAAATEDGEGAEVTATTGQPVTGFSPGMMNAYGWDSSMGIVEMTPRASSACFLTQIMGRFRSNDDRVRIRTGSTNWEITGSSSSSETNPQGTARCIAGAGEPTTYTWAAGQAMKDLGTTANRVCFLVDVYGKFDSQSDSVDVRIIGSHWYLDGGTDTGGGSARCVSNVTMVAKETVTDQQSTVFGIPHTSSRMNPYACFLTGAGGDWIGSGTTGGGLIYTADTLDQNRQWYWYVHSTKDFGSTSHGTGRCIQ